MWRDVLRPYRRDLALTVVLQTGAMLGMLAIPTLNAEIVDKGIATGDTGHIYRVGAVMLGIAVAQLAATIGVTYYGSRTAMAIGRDLRRDIYRRIQGFSAREFARFGSSSLITRCTNDVQQVQTVAQLTLTMMVTAPIIAVAGIALAVAQDPGLSSVLLVALPALAAVFVIILHRLIPLSRQMQDRVDELTRVLREQITGVRVVRAFVRDDLERARFGEVNDALRGLADRVGSGVALMYPLVMLLANLACAAVLWFGSDLPVGKLMAFTGYLMMTLMTIMLATFTALMMPRAAVSVSRIREVLETEPDLRRKPGAPQPEDGRIELSEVAYRYPGAESAVLHGVDLVAAPGEVVALVGSTGSGKTTLLELIPRLADATEGTVTIGGADVRELNLSAAVGYVPQRPFLFSGTVASNLRYGREDATDAQLLHALEVAQLGDFDLDAEVAQGGANLSGGQRQRLAIARALVARPLLYLFDDSFSAVDAATDAALRSALAAETALATVVIVAQRIATIRQADRIYVLDRGRIVGCGTHESLLENNVTYRQIVESQMEMA